MAYRHTQALDDYSAEIGNPAKVARERLVDTLMELNGLDEAGARKRASSVPTDRLARIGEMLQEDRVGNYWDEVAQDTVALFEVNAEVAAIDDLITLANGLAPR